MEYQNYLYQILSPNQALVASHLDPEKFAMHYGNGSTRYYQGKVIFAEIDVNYRHPYFDIENALNSLIPHADGKPKSTRYVKCYRTLEHIEFSAIKKLYLTSPEGYCIGLDPAPYDKTHDEGYLRTFAEIAPLKMLCLTKHNFPEFGQYTTSPNYSRGAPKLFYTQIELNTEEFLADLEERPTMSPPVPGLNSSKLRSAILRLQTDENKNTKGLSLDSSMDEISYRHIRHGFMFASQDETKFFPMPSLDEIKHLNHKFYRAM